MLTDIRCYWQNPDYGKLCKINEPICSAKRLLKKIKDGEDSYMSKETSKFYQPTIMYKPYMNTDLN